jgi:hypothetical protein
LPARIRDRLVFAASWMNPVDGRCCFPICGLSVGHWLLFSISQL